MAVIPAGYVPLSNSVRRPRQAHGWSDRPIRPRTCRSASGCGAVRRHRRCRSSRCEAAACFPGQRSPTVSAPTRRIWSRSRRSLGRTDDAHRAERPASDRGAVRYGGAGQPRIRRRGGPLRVRGRAVPGPEGMVHVPADLAEMIEGVFGLDNRRMARRAGDSGRATTPARAAAGPAQNTAALTPPAGRGLVQLPGR